MAVVEAINTFRVIPGVFACFSRAEPVFPQVTCGFGTSSSPAPALLRHVCLRLMLVSHFG